MEQVKDYFEYVKPEKAGVSSEKVREFVERLEKNNLATHSLIMARGKQIFLEHYWAPFHEDFLHRMYSVSKSFVALAIGFLEQDGKIRLEDKISQYFSNEIQNQPDENIRNQTIRDMLMMSSARAGDATWFYANTDDRVRYYFEKDAFVSKIPGLTFDYDSEGSFVLCALVERVTGMPFLVYLREKLFRHIGVSEDIHCLKCPGGHSWGDSAVLCKSMDLLKTARFVLNGGSWNGKQLLNQEYLRKATSKQIDNNPYGMYDWNTQGYGYLFWMTYRNSFFFNGMGCQFAVCVPEKDLIMVINSDNQGKASAGKVIMDGFFELIVDQMEEQAKPECPLEKKKLMGYLAERKLLIQPGDSHSEWETKINGIPYVLNSNPMGIQRISLHFRGQEGTLCYTNAQGDKKLHFGLGCNCFDRFPHEGYSAEIGGSYASGNYYRCAASGGWIEENKLQIMVQIIDRYFGNMTITLGFQEEKVEVFMRKDAEAFLDTYQGYASGKQL